MTSITTNRIAILILLLGFLSNKVLAAVEFSGLDDELENNARALVALAAAPCETPEWRVRRLFSDADKQLRSALEALGYYRFDVEKSVSFEDSECWSSHFDIQLGKPVLIRDVSVEVSGEAHDDLDTRIKSSEVRPVPGDILNHGSYSSYKRFIHSNLSSQGYFDAELIESRVTVDESLQYADIKIVVESGSRFHFGDVEFNEDILVPELLARYAEFEKGDPFDAGEISHLHEVLNGSGFFASVSIRAEPLEGMGREVPVFVTITPAKRRVYTAGAGYATDTGVQGRLGYTNRRRNDKGHQFDARLFLSQVDSEITAAYRWPVGRPTAEWARVYGGFQDKQTDTSRSEKTTLGISMSRNRSREWLETPYLDFTYENFAVAEQRDSSRLIIPGITWERTIGRDLRRVPNGHRISIDLRGAYENLGSDTTFLQATASTKWIWSPGGKTRILARADLGATAKESLDDLPATVRYFAGGDTSVRGYDFETIGPVDDDGNVTGGSHLIALSLEADWKITGNWAVAAFVDSGSAFDESNPEFKTGIGLGVRWYSPLGPIRVDFAHPLDDPDENFRLHVTLGPDL